MPAELRDLVGFLVEKAFRYWLSPITLTTVGGITLVFLVAAVVQRWRRQQFAEAWQNQLGTDATHAFFYISGLFTVIVSGPAYALANAAISRYAPFLQLNLGRDLHPFVHFVILTLSLDLISYSAHRLCHSVPLLWELHKVHHSQTMLTAFTNYRFHAFDVLLRTVPMLIPLAILGSQTEIFMAVIFLEVALNGLAHTGLPWTYGPLGYLFVNPHFHRLHHSTDPRHFGRNLGQLYTVWDYVFRTAYTGADEVPAAYGLPGEPMPRSFVGLQVVPVLTVLKRIARAIVPRRVGTTRPADA